MCFYSLYVSKNDEGSGVGRALLTLAEYFIYKAGYTTTIMLNDASIDEENPSGPQTSYYKQFNYHSEFDDDDDDMDEEEEEEEEVEYDMRKELTAENEAWMCTFTKKSLRRKAAMSLPHLSIDTGSDEIPTSHQQSMLFKRRASRSSSRNKLRNQKRLSSTV